MSRRTLAAFRLEADLVRGMDRLRIRDGIPKSEQVRRALRAYLASKGISLERPPRPTGGKR